MLYQNQMPMINKILADTAELWPGSILYRTSLMCPAFDYLDLDTSTYKDETSIGMTWE